ncbi:tetratricopeptide repeat protein 37 [Echinococcus multilocularis]|uniref:Tetratricopeptide repeat protein 37 n=1 Tax=Echinococcus multilocularis TaxID=6211 RepID=A0A068YD57_ECHMU|nr:tetratricopeptide repeat protein 37 [Echinococcus multilocularis]
MNVNTKAVTRKAKELFQQKSFDACLKELQPILDGEGDENIACLLLASACHDNLGKEDKAVDTVYKVLSLDNKNPTAWHGLSKFCMKNPNRFYSLAVQCFMHLIPHYTSEGIAKKRLECLTNFIQILVQYRLELPPGLPQLRESCSLVLASDNADSFALEAIIRLLVESAIFLPFSEDEKIFGCFTVSFTGLNEKQTDLILLKTYTERLSSCVDSGSDTAYFTLALAESFLETCQALNEGYFDDLRQPFVRLQELSLRGLKVGERWHRQGFLDVHISALSAIITYALNDFIRCDFILRDLMDFCRSSYAQVAKDITQFTTFPNAPPSTLTDFLTPRLLYTPVRLFGDSLPQGQTPLHRVFGWAGCLLLSNAAKSNFRHLLVPSINLYSTECLGAKEKLTWPLPQAVLFTECCLLIDDTTNLQHYVSFSSSSSGLLESYSVEVSIRAKLVKFWLSLRCRDLDQLAVLQEILSLRDAIDIGFPAHNHNLAGWLLLKLPSAPVDAILDHFNRGIKSDKNYFVNYLNIGHAFRSKKQDYVRALQAFRRSWQLVPGNPQIAHPLASTFCKLGKIEDAYEVYKKTDHKLFTPAMCLNYGLVALHLKKLTECVPALQRAVRSQPMNPLVWEILGESYMARGSFGIALQSLGKAIQLDSNRLMSHILYAQACTALSDYSTALTAYSRVVELLKHQKLHSLSLLANKGLIELNVKLAAQDLNSGMRTTAIHYIETALSYGSSILLCMPTSIPQWLWYHIGYALSLLLAFHDSNLKVRVPKVFVSLLSHPPKSGEDKTICLLGITSCIDISSIMLSLFLKSSTDAAVGRETLLAWICLGLLELSRANYTQTGDEGEVARPLFGKFMCFTKASQRYLLQSEACFLRALQVCKQLQPGNDQLAALAWFGMGSVLALGGDLVARQSAYCFAMAFSLCSQFLHAGVSLASKLLEINRKQDARRVLDVCQRKDFQHHGYWLVMAQLASVNPQQTASVTKFGEPGVTQYLLQSVSFGFNLDAMWHILPRVFQSFKRSSTTETSGYDEESIKWSRLTAAEYLNRCLAFYPNDYRQWHDRGLLLHLSGLPHPAHYCLRRAYNLLSVFTPTDYERLTVKAHYFLSSCSQGKLDQSLCEEFQALAADPPIGCGVCAATAFANLFKGKSDAARNSLVRAYRAAGMEVTLGSLSCLAPALLHAALPSEVEGLWEELTSFSVDPIRRLVIAEGLHVKPPSLALHHLSAFLSHPSYGYEYFLFQFRNSSTTEHIRHLLTLSKSWALLRPDSEPVWTLLAATLRLYSRLQGVKPKSRVAAREGAVASLLSAFTVRSPDPTSETLTQELVHFVKSTTPSERSVLKSLKPLVLICALFFPYVRGVIEALHCV